MSTCKPGTGASLGSELMFSASPEPSSCSTATGCGQAQNPSAEASL